VFKEVYWRGESNAQHPYFIEGLPLDQRRAAAYSLPYVAYLREKDIPSIPLVAAPGRDILPHQKAESVGVIEPSPCIHLHVFADGVEAHLLHRKQVANEGFVCSGGVETCRDMNGGE
jgi:hypothetical protein